MAHSPATAQWELTNRIRSRREELDIDVVTISKSLGFSRSYWSTVENNKVLLAPNKIDKLIETLKLDEAEAQEYIDLYKLARRPRWWEEYDSLLSEDLQYVIGLEAGAQRVDIYEGLLITGLLQTPNYAKAVIETASDASRASVRKRLELRKRRQERLSSRENPIELRVLMSEGSVLQHVGPPEILLEQLNHLVSLSSELGDSLEIRIIPFTESQLGMTGAATTHLLYFDSVHLRPVAWREAVTPIGISDDVDEVEILRTGFEQALDHSSLSPAASIEMIRQRADELSNSMVSAREVHGRG